MTQREEGRHRLRLEAALRRRSETAPRVEFVRLRCEVCGKFILNYIGPAAGVLCPHCEEMADDHFAACRRFVDRVISSKFCFQ